jgi:hypothetical protein
VTSVIVAGTSWSSSFRNTLVTAGTGNGTGYEIPGGAAQLAPLGWGNVNQVQIAFNTDVTLSASSLSVTGDTSGAYAISGFTYSHTTHIATWTLARPLSHDTIHLALQSTGANGVDDSLANPLDGEWSDGASSYPSGDGFGGGDFNFALRILPGNANGDNIVNAQDLALVSSNWLKAGPTGDVNGDGIVNAQDLAIISSTWLSSLPAAPGGGANSLVQNATAVPSTSVATTPVTVIATVATTVESVILGPFDPSLLVSAGLREAGSEAARVVSSIASANSPSTGNSLVGPSEQSRVAPSAALVATTNNAVNVSAPEIVPTLESGGSRAIAWGPLDEWSATVDEELISLLAAAASRPR